jgi:hypothetical protein
MATSPDTTNYGRGFATPGLGSAGAYQVSGFPFITGSVGPTHPANTTYEIVFPAVTKSITFMPTTQVGVVPSTFKVSFADPATNTRVVTRIHELNLPAVATLASQPLTLDVKCSRIWISEYGGNPGGWQLYAALTSVNPAATFHLSGSGING